MRPYFIKTPRIVKWLFSSYVWDLPASGRTVYLTFDDGPHPTITPWVLDELKKYEARATFFCLGKNVAAHPRIYQRIQEEGHAVGNHTFHHLNGWKTGDEIYTEDTVKAARFIESSLFRPPYGKIRRRQGSSIKKALGGGSIIMWDVLSADFDRSISAEQCLQNVVRHTRSGSIVVFHDSEKAFPHLQYVLPRVLEQLTVAGYRFECIEALKK